MSTPREQIGKAEMKINAILEALGVEIKANDLIVNDVEITMYIKGTVGVKDPDTIFETKIVAEVLR